jgi:hypothetical protein
VHHALASAAAFTISRLAWGGISGVLFLMFVATAMCREGVIPGCAWPNNRISFYRSRGVNRLPSSVNQLRGVSAPHSTKKRPMSAAVRMSHFSSGQGWFNPLHVGLVR